MALRLRRGTDAERLLITPLQGELLFATDTKQIFVGDGATVGGVLVGPVDAETFDLVNDTTPQLGGDLDLNNNNITGVGNINIDGTISATGNIGLGDADADQITVGGVINSSLRPAQTETYSLGTENRKWQHVYASGVTIDQTLTVESIVLNNNIFNGSDSSIVYNATTDSLFASNIEGDLTGSVFSNDSSTVLVDANNSELSNGTITLSGKFINAVAGDEIVLDVPNIVQHKYGIDNSPDNMAYLSILGGRGTRAAPLAVQPGDFPTSLSMQAYNGTNIETKTLITTLIDTVSGTNALPAKLLFTVHDFDGNYATYGSLNARGTFEMPVFKPTAFATTTERDALIATPEAGMVVFVTDSDGGGTEALQVYKTVGGWTDIA